MTISEDKPLEDPEAIRTLVKEGYTRVAERAPGCCHGPTSHVDDVAHRIGYTDQELRAVPDGANLGVGCGNPTAIEALRPGEVVVDLGSGAGMDAFIAARRVGPTGHVIGVDMTDAMLEKARANAIKAGLGNVEFRKGTIEELPLKDESADVIISNCVINLSPQKSRVFAEAYRVLRRGGKLMISDLVLERPLPPEIKEAADAYVGCVGGASLRQDYLRAIREAGFEEPQVRHEASFVNAVSFADPQLREVMSRFHVTEAQVKEALRGVTSLHVLALKDRADSRELPS